MASANTSSVSSDRLAELQRQRALVQEHLAWLDREITRTAGDASTFPPPPIIRATRLPPVLTDVSLASSIEYQPDPVAAARRTKFGCIIALIVTLGLIGASLTAIYLLRYRDHPVLFMSDDKMPDHK